MLKDELKQAAAEAALAYIELDMVLGVGSGTTVHFFIDALKKVKGKIDAVVASSEETALRLKAIGLHVVELNSVSELTCYIDGADEVNSFKQLIKGGGAALTREKILASAAKRFVCIADESKRVDILGEFPVAVEVISMARSFVAREIVKFGADPVYRSHVITDNGNVILDVYNMKLLHPLEWEQKLNNIAGVVANGIFASRTADVVLLSTQNGVVTF